ncbi:3-dehydroquinate dehydratase [Philodulcilactobacillus myokoensis]|uniref:3-dehydroquinate dehydratase n=1 Tax=Philodulcilactobacillus myokoensis TaxID=2929573 RepID=A0A9W6B345_9LACO|nr:type I 3-dehydroquinate dehydratase [Philodulcilactobacillus myokoensis]GLB47368.1 3-dehydroquinate dehydratase [Philodulcilactobacillus myokoensis]
MTTLTINNLKIGAGKPKVCVPITAATSDEVIAEGSKLLTTSADLVLLRLDYLENIKDADKTIQTIQTLRHWTTGLPLIVDLRTKASGANIALSDEDIQSVLIQIITAKVADAIKIDDRLDPKIQNRIKNAANNNQIRIITAHYYLMQRPTKDQMVDKIDQLEQTKLSDLVEISTIPTNKEQVLDLMQACLTASRNQSHPIIITAVGPLGKTIQLASVACNNSIIYEPLKDANYLGQYSITQLSKMNKML